MGADLAAEEQFGPYLVYERLGVGGMATVHRALERGIEGFERIVALKRLLPHLAEDASFIKAFVREAKLASILNHNNIVQIYELGRVGTEYFISMEYIDGRDVRRILRHARKVSGTPPIHITVGLVLQLAEALDYAHTKCDDEGHPMGLVHRDVSPSNLLVTSQGHLKVIDFGIAKAQSAHLRTQTGRVKGKIAYMAPEATTSARDLDARSDLWAAGVIAHELLTARPLFASKNEYQTLLKVQRGDIMPPSTFNQAVPPELDAIVLKALARDPEERFPDASHMREALLDLRRKLRLQTGYRDISQWLDWAFSIEAPSGAFERVNSASGSGAFDIQEAARSLAGMSSAHLTPTPQPRREDDDAVEFAWGGGDGAQGKGPIELDDVPDVSQKHHQSARVELPHHDDLGDDIPPPEPSHGIPRPKRDTAPQGSRGSLASIPPPIPLPLPAPKDEPDTARDRSSTEKGHGQSRSKIPVITAEEERRVTAPMAPPHLDPEEVAFEPPVRETLDDVLQTVEDDPLIKTQPKPRRKQPSEAVPVAESVESKSRLWIWVIVVMLLAAAGLAVYLFVLRPSEDAPAVIEPAPKPEKPVPKRGTVKLEIDPPDVTVTIAGQTHQGSPWSVELDAGAHQIEVRREGYKSRVTSIELAEGETRALPITLEKVPRKVGREAAQTATLIVVSTPPDLEVVLDGQPLAERTPINRMMSPGKHTVALRQNGTEVWSTTLVAEADADHELRPVIQRIVGKTEPDPGSGSSAGSNTSLKPRVVGPAISGPVTVAATAVKRIAGDTPTIASKSNLPVTAKVCIDPAGAVTTVEISTKLDRAAITDLTKQIQAWRYAPYMHQGVASPVCFPVAFRSK